MSGLNVLNFLLIIFIVFFTKKINKNGAVALKFSAQLLFREKNNCQTSKVSDSCCKILVCNYLINYKKIILKIQMDIN